MFFLPPRIGKSELVSRRFPAYVFGREPDMNIIATSYSDKLAGRNNRDVQRIIDLNAYRELFPDTQLFGKNIRTLADNTYLRNSEIFEIVDNEGVYVAAGVGCGISGMGGDILIIDDPIKDAEQAESPTYRDNVWDWYLSTAYTRVEAGGGVLLCMTRWQEDDLAGRLQEAAKSGGDEWDIVSYPAIAEHDEEHRKAGEALHEERWSLERLEKIKGALAGGRYWVSLYQQRPSPEEGGIIKRDWWKIYRKAPNRFDEIIQSWDCAFKDLKTSDFVVGQVWGRIGADKYLLDQVRGKMTFTETLMSVRAVTAKHPKAKAKLVEDKANGTAVMDTLKHEIPGIIAVEPQGGKIARAQAVTPDIEAGNVYLPDPTIAPWIGDFIEECAAFPNGANDDQVDAMSQALARLSKPKSKAEVWMG